MPPKADLKRAINKGVNPYAVANSMIKKGQLPPHKKEAAVKHITRSAIKK